MIEKVVLNDREYWQATVGDKSRLFDMDKKIEALEWLSKIARPLKDAAIAQAARQRELAEAAKAVPPEQLRRFPKPKRP